MGAIVGRDIVPCGVCQAYVSLDGGCRHVRLARTRRVGTTVGTSQTPALGLSPLEKSRLRNREYQRRLRAEKRMLRERGSST